MTRQIFLGSKMTHIVEYPNITDTLDTSEVNAALDALHQFESITNKIYEAHLRNEAIRDRKI